VHSLHVPVLLLIGSAVLAGSVGARLFQRLRIPQVVGYIVIGAIVGRSGLQLVDDAALDALLPLSFLALGMIGFLIGGELHLRIFKQHGKQFLAVLLAEGIMAAIVVGALVGVITFLATGDARISIAFGLVLGLRQQAFEFTALFMVCREDPKVSCLIFPGWGHGGR